ncbi:putative peptidase M22 [Mycobacterium avium MAV_061107_1842]|nr:putative peptidase M22 [Mycobacterium avium MAV_061107_1842]
MAGSPEHARLFGLPVTGPAHPTPAGLVAAVGDWSVRPQPLVPLYLRRPDATPRAARP